jgi:hypothetical protein
MKTDIMKKQLKIYSSIKHILETLEVNGAGYKIMQNPPTEYPTISEKKKLRNKFWCLTSTCYSFFRE